MLSRTDIFIYMSRSAQLVFAAHTNHNTTTAAVNADTINRGIEQLTTKGDIIMGTTSGPSRLPVGSNKSVLSTQTGITGGTDILWKTESPLTTKGDMHIRGLVDDDRVVVPVSTAASSGQLAFFLTSALDNPQNVRWDTIQDTESVAFIRPIVVTTMSAQPKFVDTRWSRPNPLASLQDVNISYVPQTGDTLHFSDVGAILMGNAAIVSGVPFSSIYTTHDVYEWSCMTTTAPPYARDILRVGSEYFLLTGDHKIATSYDMVTWALNATNLDTIVASNAYHQHDPSTQSVSSAFLHDGVKFVVGGQRGSGMSIIAYSFDGLTWAPSSIVGMSTTADSYTIAISKLLDDDTYFALTANPIGLLTSTDGISWVKNVAATTLLGAPLAANWGDIQCETINGGNPIVAWADSAVIRSHDGGGTWTSVGIGVSVLSAIVGDNFQSPFVFLADGRVGELNSILDVLYTTPPPIHVRQACLTGNGGLLLSDKTNRARISTCGRPWLSHYRERMLPFDSVTRFCKILCATRNRWTN